MPKIKINPLSGIPVFPPGGKTLHTLIDRKGFFDLVPPPLPPPYDPSNPVAPSTSTARNQTYFAPGQIPNMIGSINPYIQDAPSSTAFPIEVPDQSNSIYYNDADPTTTTTRLTLNYSKPEITDIYQTPIDWSIVNNIITRPQIVWLEMRIGSCYFTTDPLYYLDSTRELITYPHLGRKEVTRLAPIFAQVKQYIEALRPGRTWVTILNWVKEFDDFFFDGLPGEFPSGVVYAVSMDWLNYSQPLSVENFGDESAGTAWGAGFIQCPATQASFFGTNFLHIYIGDAIIQGAYLNDAQYSGVTTPVPVTSPIFYCTDPPLLPTAIEYTNSLNPHGAQILIGSYQPNLLYTGQPNTTEVLHIGTGSDPPEIAVYQGNVQSPTGEIIDNPDTPNGGPYTPVNTIPDSLGIWSIIYDQRLKSNVNKFCGYSVKLFNPPNNWDTIVVDPAVDVDMPGTLPTAKDITIWQDTGVFFDAVASIAFTDGIDITHPGTSTMIDAQYLINLIANHYRFDPKTGKDL